jgi:hypothetical protein
MGTVAGTTTYAAHTAASGWDNDNLSFTGTGELRATSPSTGYTGASGAANVFLTNNGTANFQIAAIDTSLYQTTFTLSFGAFKSSIASDMSELALAYSDDGTNYTSISIPAQPTGSGTAVWRLISLPNLTLPSVGNLRLRWTNTSTTPQFRVDDVMLEGTAIPEPTAFLFGGLVCGAFGLRIAARRAFAAWMASVRP